jgi:3D (Asp-Asp-Asp) domain-containing protein
VKIKSNALLQMAMILLILVSGIMYEFDSNKIKELQKQNVMLKKEIRTQLNQIAKQENDIRDKEKEIENIKAETEKLKQEAERLRQEIEESKMQKIVVNASAYSQSLDEGAGQYKTATGYSIKNTITYEGMGIIATDTRIIPLYSIVKIEGFSQLFIVLDRGGGIKGKKIDVLLGSKQECFNFGRKDVVLTIIRKGL